MTGVGVIPGAIIGPGAPAIGGAIIGWGIGIPIGLG